MGNPFSSGHKELLSKAKRNPISSVEDFIPSTWQQTKDAFDKSYYGVGIGIKKEELGAVQNELRNLDDQKLSFDDTIGLKNYYTMRFNGIEEEKVQKKFGDEGIKYYNDLIAKHSEKIKQPEQLKGEVKSRILGEVQEAEQRLEKGDSMTALIAGGVAGAFTNPAILASTMIPVGAGINIAKSGSIVAQILKTSAIEGVVGAGVELSTIEMQRQNAAYLNKELSNWDIAKNVALAGGGAFLLTALAKSGLDTFTYIKELRKGTDEAANIVINKLDKTPDNKAAIRQMDDLSYTAERALEGDEFKPLYGKDITPEQYNKHMDDANQAFKDVSDFGGFERTNNYQPDRIAIQEKKDFEIMRSTLTKDITNYIERQVSPTEQDKNLLDLVRDFGGISKSEAISEGIDPAAIAKANKANPGNPIFKEDGLSFDGLAERLKGIAGEQRVEGELDANSALNLFTEVLEGRLKGEGPELQALMAGGKYDFFPDVSDLSRELGVTGKEILKALKSSTPGVKQKRIIKEIDDIITSELKAARAQDLDFSYSDRVNKAVAEAKVQEVALVDYKAIDDELIYKELLTESDRAFDAELYKQASELDIDIPVGTRTGKEGEIIIDTRSAKELSKQVDDEISALSAISMCMRGSA